MFSAETKPREDIMEHSNSPDAASSDPTRAERQARADWLVTELGRRAAVADDPREQARLRRTADSLVRLAIAFRS